MNYPFELRRREVATVQLRRSRAGQTAASGHGNSPETRPCSIADPSQALPAQGTPSDELPANTVALALSGGGIRCATFSLGVLQALAKNNQLRAIDFLSTVSGGGYIGGFLGRLFMRQVIASQTDPCERVQSILRNNQSSQLQWLRTHANYIVSQGGSDVRQHLAVFWRNLSCIYLVLTFLGLAVFGLLRLGGDWLSRRFGTPEFVASMGMAAANALSRWWWLPIAVLAVAVVPCALAYWLAPKLGTRASFSFFPIAAWITLLAGLAISLSLGGSLWPCLSAGGIVLLSAAWLECARRRLPRKLDRSTQEASTDPGTVVRNRLTRALGEALVLFFACVSWVILDTLARGLAQGTLSMLIAAWGMLLVPVLPFLRRWATLLGHDDRKTNQDKDSRRSLFASRQFRAGLIAFPLAAFLLVVLDGAVHWLSDQRVTWGIAAMLLGAALSLVLSRAFDFLNYSALHQSYAARLSRTFLGASNPARFRAAGHEEGRDVQVTHPDDDLAFDQYHPELNGGPLHLIGLCVNETVDAASQRDIRDRKALPMCVSPCGVSVGRRFHAVWSRPPANLPWRTRLQRWLDARGPVRMNCDTALCPIPAAGELFHVLKGRKEGPVAVEPLRLGTWIAISGAAFGTGTGRFTSLPIALLFGLTNVRLGYWWDSGLTKTERPGQYPGNLWRRLKSWPASLVRMQSLLLSDFQGRFDGPSHRFWNISDGGHFDTTGIYELVRRRVPFIIAVDGGEDPNLTFADTADLVREARIDFGANIEFVDPASALAAGGAPCDPNVVPAWIAGWLDPHALGKLSDIGRKCGKHGALAKVTYNSEPHRISWIVLLKASLTKDEPLDIAAYKSVHADFPGESTTDQFFDEAQWESYRMLGEHVGASILSKKPSPSSQRPGQTGD